MKIKGEVAIVTGASSGIGLAVTRDLAARGASVAMLARRRKGLEDARRSLGAHARKCAVYPCDVGKWEAVQTTIRKIAKSRGRPSILVNNAGISEVVPFAQMKPEDMERIVRTNLLGVLYCTRAALVPMRAARRGVIVNVSSIAGLIAVPLMSVYASTKWALTGLSESLNGELAGEGIHVGAVCPAIVETPLVTREEARTGIAIPEAITLKPESVSKAILEVITKERDMVVVPRALGAVAAMRPTLAPLLRWAARESTSYFKPRLQPAAPAKRKRS
ncbi:MAG: SDR family NAD(P)-dependent oxidoreductase [Myxococcota bacterium]